MIFEGTILTTFRQFNNNYLEYFYLKLKFPTYTFTVAVENAGSMLLSLYLAKYSL